MRKVQKVDKSWNFDRSDTKNSVHSLHSYPAMLTPSLVNRLFDEYDKTAKVLLDPFVGSGTVLVESLRRNFSEVYGFDINPLALLIAKVKTTQVPDSKLIKYRKQIEQKYIRYSKDKLFFKELLPKDYDVSYWFKPSVSINLTRLKKAINSIPDNDVKDFFKVVFAEIVLKVSYKRPSEFKMYRREKSELKDFKPDVLSEFLKKSEDNINKISEFRKLLKTKSLPKINIINQDARLKSKLKNNFADMVITSPPYGDSRTTVAYGQFSKLGGLWLDLPGIVSLDNSCLGGNTKNDSQTIKSPTLNLSLSRIKKIDEKRAKEVKSFFDDFKLCMDEIDRVLKKGKFVFLIVGNRCVKGNIIPTDKIVVEMFKSKNYSHINTIKRDIPFKRMPRYVSPSGIKGKKNLTMQNEYIVIMQKGI